MGAPDEGRKGVGGRSSDPVSIRHGGGGCSLPVGVLTGRAGVRISIEGGRRGRGSKHTGRPVAVAVIGLAGLCPAGGVGEKAMPERIAANAESNFLVGWPRNCVVARLDAVLGSVIVEG